MEIGPVRVPNGHQTNGRNGHGQVQPHPNNGNSHEIKYPSNCASRISNEPSFAASIASADGIVDIGALDKLYEPKENKKLFKVVTVVAYVFSVSMVAILLSLYYLFLWNPYIKQHQKAMEKMGREKNVSVISTLATTTTSNFADPTTFLPKTLALAAPASALASSSSWRKKLMPPSASPSPSASSFGLHWSRGEPPGPWGVEGGVAEVNTDRSTSNHFQFKTASHLEDPFTTYAKAKRAKERERGSRHF